MRVAVGRDVDGVPCLEMLSGSPVSNDIGWREPGRPGSQALRLGWMQANARKLELWTHNVR
jgi:hypothetical protein